jgi:hypothetical protein
MGTRGPIDGEPGDILLDLDEVRVCETLWPVLGDLLDDVGLIAAPSDVLAAPRIEMGVMEAARERATSPAASAGADRHRRSHPMASTACDASVSGRATSTGINTSRSAPVFSESVRPTILASHEPLRWPPHPSPRR